MKATKRRTNPIKPNGAAKPNPRKLEEGRAPSAPFNFVADHMTLLLAPSLYKIAYALFRIILGVPRSSIVYEKRKRWPGAAKEASMTFAADIGDAFREAGASMARTMIAVVQPTEPAAQSSHVRDMLASHGPSAHLQHIALRTPDLLGFYAHARARGVNFITPIMREDDEDLLQVFSGELYAPGTAPTGLFFEFVQRTITPELLHRLESLDREAFFKDRTFLGLYGEKEREYQSGAVTPFIDHALMARIQEALEPKALWEITDADLASVEKLMLDYAARR